MPRSLVASLLGVALVLAWIAGAATLADVLAGVPSVVLGLYYALAGVGWVLPAWFLMRWAARPR